MTDLSPAAQVVLDAYGNQIGGTDAIMGSERRGVAAALRAASREISAGTIPNHGEWSDGHEVGVTESCLGLHAIAAELEAQQ